MSESTSIQSALVTAFADQRIVIWHDPESEYVSDLTSLELPEVEIVQVENNEFGLKYRMLREEPKRKFLVYRSGAVPQGIDNWLLDIELAFGTFSADKGSLIQQELGLAGAEMQRAIDEHAKFFGAGKRVSALKARLVADDDATRIRAKMTAVLCGTQIEHRLSEIMRVLLQENAGDKAAIYDQIVLYGLDTFLWDGISRIYKYKSQSPTISDFVLWLFQTAMNGFQSDTPAGLRDIQIDFSSLRYDVRFGKSYAVLARRAAIDLDIESKITGADFRTLLDSDLFELIDNKIISDLARGVADRTLLTKDVSEYVRRRQSSFWIDSFKNLYAAIDEAADLLSRIDSLNTAMQTFDDGLKKYTTHWYRIDQLYRQFTLHARDAEDHGPLQELRTQVESFYSNKYLQALGAAWQKQVDVTDVWRSKVVASQTSFYTDHVKPIVAGGRNKAVVIISDAMRFEIADELGSRIRQEDRFEAELTPVLGVLPSYTQLGMAALLPHGELSQASKNNLLVTSDGQPTDGIANRNKLLQEVGGIAVKSEAVLKLGRDAARELFKSNQLIYVYHNLIDKTGDDPGNEDRVFKAVEDTFTELMTIIKTLVNANATNILVTADHGFLYQDGGLDESGYLSVEPQGDSISVRNRRFVLGTGLKEDSAFKKYSPNQLGLSGDLEVQIPKSTHRLRVKGSGFRFVHGGATLQEIVVPVLTINKKRKSDTRPVTVEILPETNVITTGQIAIKLIQAVAVDEKIQPRSLRAGLYVGDVLISNQVETLFDVSSSDKRDRYVTVTMLLRPEANEYNNRAVEFRLEQPVPNTTRWTTYAKAPYTLKRSFMTDF